MRGMNRATLIGNLGKDPETRYTANGKAVANFSMATSEQWKDANGEKKEKVEWHNVIVWEKLAEIAGQYLKKGDRVLIEGKITTRKWQDKDGKDRYTTEIVAHDLMMLNGKPAGERQQAPPAAAQKADQPFDGADDIPF